ncbi:HAD family hydrolase [Haloarcula onubensis]|uniref:HAD-IA family hydrolase n=1 Tax=Haloarcula onubensis TaxID=2950539 RepID=A0ABU2FNC0_9EURY|nr:HAD-IA family hydrolase [Halomicroarcula sp. S3CR25-11]MDS0282249.1 HAD-IA family hydrolase [Halomicroarcula sp. S3CR25-11]
MAEYDALLLDHDGVLLTLTDRSTLRETALAALRDAGVEAPEAADAERLSIRVSTDELVALADRHALAPERLWRCREDRIEACLREAIEAGRKAPYDDVAALDGVDIPTGVVSNNQRRVIHHALDSHDMADWFETVVAREPTLDSLAEKKPEPTYIQAATAAIGASNPLYVGDSATDVVAAERAGVDVAFLRRGHNADATLDTRPTHDVESLHAVVDLL